MADVLSKILENEASDWKAAEEFGGYVLDDELREARAVDEAMRKRFTIAFQNTPGDEAIANDVWNNPSSWFRKG